jgi:hypothetical protein
MRYLTGLIVGLILLVSCGGARPGATPPPTLSGKTPAPPPTSAPTMTTDDLMEQAYAQLREGQLAFNPPQEMRLGESAVVRLRLTRYANVAAPTLVAGLGSDRRVLTDTVRVGSTMRAQLSGDTFQVESLSSEEQLVVGDAYNEWAWRVAPQAGGRHALTLRISAVITVDREKMIRDFPVKETTVTVQVSLMRTVGQALGNHWKELLGMLVPTGSGAVGIWVWQKLRRKRDEHPV